VFLLRFSRPESAEVSAFARDSQRGSRVQRKLSTKLRTAIFGPGDCAAATFLTCRARRGRGYGPRWRPPAGRGRPSAAARRSEEHTSDLQSLMRISYAVF